MHASERLLTGSAQWCVLPRTPFATCALEPAGWGKPSWSRERRDTPTSAGTGTDTPPAGPLGAADAREYIKHMPEPSALLYMCVLHSFFLVISACASLRRVFSFFERSPGSVLALSAVLTQQAGFEIYGSVGVSGALAACERGPSVFITLSCRISPNT